jgi:hypothetical protein
MFYRVAAAVAALAFGPRAGEAPKPITVSGLPPSFRTIASVAFRKDRALAVQAGLTVSHESGLYVGTWASNLSGWGTFGGSNTELDIYGGYKMPIGGVTVDVGLTWYMYPGGADKTDFAEPYVKLSGTVGPVSCWRALPMPPSRIAGPLVSERGVLRHGRARCAGRQVGQPLCLDRRQRGDSQHPGHAESACGYSDGNAGLGPNGTSVAPTGKYADWMLGADVAVGPVVLGVAYVDTDISNKEALYLQPNFSQTKNGSSIAGARWWFRAPLPSDRLTIGLFRMHEPAACPLWAGGLFWATEGLGKGGALPTQPLPQAGGEYANPPACGRGARLALPQAR